MDHMKKDHNEQSRSEIESASKYSAAADEIQVLDKMRATEPQSIQEGSEIYLCDVKSHKSFQRLQNKVHLKCSYKTQNKDLIIRHLITSHGMPKQGKSWTWNSSNYNYDQFIKKLHSIDLKGSELLDQMSKDRSSENS